MKIDFFTDITKDYNEALTYPAVDRLMVKILWWHLAAFSLLVVVTAIFKIANYFPSPFGWRVIEPTEAIVVFLLALVSTIIPALLLGKIKNHYLWRVIVTVALVMYSYLLVFTSGGAIEMHFHFFIIITLMVMYADWRLGWIILVLTALHHGILNYVEPGWVYFYGRNDFSVISHALPVLVAVIITTILCENIRRGVAVLETAKSGLKKTVEERTIELENLKINTETKLREQTIGLLLVKERMERDVAARTNDLRTKTAEVEQMNQILLEKESKISELKKSLGSEN